MSKFAVPEIDLGSDHTSWELYTETELVGLEPIIRVKIKAKHKNKIQQTTYFCQ